MPLLDIQIKVAQVTRFLASTQSGLSILFVAWLVGCIGGSSFFFSWIPLLCIIACTYSHVYRKQRRARRAQRWAGHEALQLPNVASKVYNEQFHVELPGWMSSPAREQSAWFGLLLTSIWPYIAAATEKSLKYSLDGVLTAYKPGFLSKLEPGCMKLGPIAPKIHGMEAHVDDQTKWTVIDMDITFSGQTDMKIIAGTVGVTVEARVPDLQIKGRMRIVLGPHYPVWPCFSCMSISFVGKPVVDLSLKAAKIPLDAIPGLSNWLDGFLKNTLALLMVYPRRLVIPILWNQEQEVKLTPIGKLKICVQRCEGLPERKNLLQLEKDTCVVAETTALGNDKYPSMLKVSGNAKGRNPIYRENNTFEVAVYGLPNEKLILRVTEGQSTNILTKAATKARKSMGFSDTVIGHVKIEMKSIISGAASGDCCTPLEGHQCREAGKLFYNLNFVRDAEAAIKTVIEEKKKEEYEYQTWNAQPVGMLWLTVRNCKNLPKRKDASVIIEFSSEEREPIIKTSSVAKGDPMAGGGFQWTFKEESHSFIVFNVPNEKITLKVLDDSSGANLMTRTAKKATQSLGIDEAIFGFYEIFVSTLIDVSCEKRDAPLVNINKKKTESVGTISFSTEFKPFNKTGEEMRKFLGSETVEPDSPLAKSSHSNSGVAVIYLDRAENLPKADLFGLSDPYVVFRIGHATDKSKIIQKCLNPVYNSTHQLSFHDLDADILQVDVYDHDLVTKDELICSTSIKLAEVAKNSVTSQKFELNPKGTITLDIRITTR